MDAPVANPVTPATQHPASDAVRESIASGAASRWAKRGGIVLFLFFLAKGLVWLGILAAAGFGATKL